MVSNGGHPASAQPASAQPTSTQPVGEWLAELGSAAPAPGGGAAAALSAALGAALVEMVCNLTLGKPAYAGHERDTITIRDAAARLRQAALTQADADATAFRELMAAFRLPKGSEAEKAARAAAVQAATLRAATVPLHVAATAAGVAELAARLPGRSNPNVLSDVGVAAACAVAAIEAAAINVEINLGSLADGDARSALREQLGQHLAAARQAQQLAARVRREVTR
jgi:methenyltetrahydrofolate cyclohydrolase